MVVAELEKTLSSFPAVHSVVSLLDGVVEKLSALKRKVSTHSHVLHVYSQSATCVLTVCYMCTHSLLHVFSQSATLCTHSLLCVLTVFYMCTHSLLHVYSQSATCVLTV